MVAATEPPSFLATRRGKLTLAFLCAVGFLDFVDASIVNVALPTIRDDLHFSVQSLQWVLSAYLLTYGGFMLLGGRAGDLLLTRAEPPWSARVSTPPGRARAGRPGAQASDEERAAVHQVRGGTDRSDTPEAEPVRGRPATTTAAVRRPAGTAGWRVRFRQSGRPAEGKRP